MGFVAVAMIFFLIVQWPYIFVNVPAETELAKYGVSTYSEYVTKGFYELLFITGIIYILTWTGLIFYRGKNNGQKTILVYIQMIVLVAWVELC